MPNIGSYYRMTPEQRADAVLAAFREENKDLAGADFRSDGGFGLRFHKMSEPRPAGGPELITKPSTEPVPGRPGLARRALGAVGGAVGKVGEFIEAGGPGFSRLMGTLGQAATATVPSSWQYQLGGAISRTAAGQQMEALARREELTGVAGFGLTPEERATVAAQALAGERMGLEERRTAAMESGIETPEQRMERELAVTRARPVARKGLQLQTIPIGGEQVSGVFDPETGTFGPVASSPIQRTGEVASLKTGERWWFNKATKVASDELGRLGYGMPLQLMDGSWTVKWNEEALSEFGDSTRANEEYKRILGREVDKMISTGDLPARFRGLVEEAAKPTVEY